MENMESNECFRFFFFFSWPANLLLLLVSSFVGEGVVGLRIAQFCCWPSGPESTSRLRMMLPRRPLKLTKPSAALLLLMLLLLLLPLLPLLLLLDSHTHTRAHQTRLLVWQARDARSLSVSKFGVAPVVAARDDPPLPAACKSLERSRSIARYLSTVGGFPASLAGSANFQ